MASNRAQRGEALSSETMEPDLHYTDPRLAALYDLENAGREDTAFYHRLATELGARSVIDLGCGTGVLACTLAAAGLRVMGVDPAAAMLDIARSRPGCGQVTWVLGDAASLPSAAADLVIMAGHVAQVFLDDPSWERTLAHAFRALLPGGHLAFETLNPEPEPWRHWTRERTTSSYALPGGGTVTTWIEPTSVAEGRVTLEGHNVLEGGEHIAAPSTLRFRSRRQVETSLTTAGFEVVEVWGDWDRGAASSGSAELIFLGRRP